MTMLTNEQLEELIRFANDDRSPVSTEAVEALNNLNAQVQKNLLRHLTGLRKQRNNLQEKLNKIKELKTERVLEGEFEDSQLDSVDVALGLLYQLQQRKTYKLTKYKLQDILYEMYASWLASKTQRLFEEHPVATEYGPRFWRVFKRVDVSVPVTFDTWKNLCEKNPGIAKFCENAAQKYYDYSETTLNRKFMASKPYKNADKMHNNGKWNKEISDKDIYEWKSSSK